MILKNEKQDEVIQAEREREGRGGRGVRGDGGGGGVREWA